MDDTGVERYPENLLNLGMTNSTSFSGYDLFFKLYK